MFCIKGVFFVVYIVIWIKWFPVYKELTILKNWSDTSINHWEICLAGVKRESCSPSNIKLCHFKRHLFAQLIGVFSDLHAGFIFPCLQIFMKIHPLIGVMQEVNATCLNMDIDPVLVAEKPLRVSKMHPMEKARMPPLFFKGHECCHSSDKALQWEQILQPWYSCLDWNGWYFRLTGSFRKMILACPLESKWSYFQILTK